MKKKQIRLIAIAAIILVFFGMGLARLKIEPADSSHISAPDAPLSTVSEAEEPAVVFVPPVDEMTEPADMPGDATQQQPATPVPTTVEEQPTPTQPAASEPPVETERQPTQEDPPAETETQPSQEKPPAETETQPSVHTCTLEIRCDTVVDTSKLENEAVIPYVPADGVILAATEVTYTPGESVFEVLKRVTREQGIQMEFRDDPLYSGAYIEGINYLYEFDGGTLSGWMYKVNGQFPNYGCSQYTVEDNDAIVWMYTCDLGRDVGDNSTW